MKQGTGNINYSLNKNDFYKIIVGGLVFFIPFYYILVLISFLYLFTIRFSKYYFSNRNEKYRNDIDIVHYFKSITYSSPFDILNINFENKGNDKYVGLSNISYLILIVSYVITFLIILQGIIRSFLYSIYSNIIQINNNNNPYNNPNTVTKTNINSYSNSLLNYIYTISLSFIFLIPFSISYIINFFHFDNYNIKHTKWFDYVILFIILFPLIFLLISYSTFQNKLSILPNLNNYLESEDYPFITFLINNFNLKIYSILPFLFIIFIYCCYKMIFTDFNYTFKKSLLVYFILFIIIFLFIPFVIFFFSLSLVFTPKKNNLKENDESDIIQNIQKYGISSLYDLLVKYNYPCFPK
jgi:hypothetical protein